MKKIATLALFLAPQISLAQSSVGGVVVADHYTCNTYDRIVIETNRGYTNAEVYRGYNATLEGDIIYGELHSFGFTDIYDNNGRDIGRLYIDDYMVSESSAVEWCTEE
jgi:hypothetical protein